MVEILGSELLAIEILLDDCEELLQKLAAKRDRLQKEWEEEKNGHQSS